MNLMTECAQQPEGRKKSSVGPTENEFYDSRDM
jgi:hypothetical protein